jgi:hypothetical protein
VSSAALARERWGRPTVRRIDVAIVAFVVPAALMAWGLATVHGRAYALIALLPCLAAVAFRARPVFAATAIGIGATVLRLSYLGIGYSTQVDHARSAGQIALAGESPYGALIPTAGLAEPYVYGPLGLIWWQPGVIIELLAAVAVTAILIRTGSWLTLAAYSGLPFSIYLTTTGVNDYSPGFLITVALLLLRARPVGGAVVLAIAAGVKPYAFAWFLSAIGYGRWRVLLTLGLTTGLVWSPLLVWGPAALLRSLELHREVHPESANTVNIPILQWTAIPIAVVGVLFRRWEWAVLIGSAAFVVFLFFGWWASLGYWIAVLPVAGIALERLWVRRSRPIPSDTASPA